jgi:hypothetical protein
MRPLARWTFGNCSLAGEEILKHSLKRFSVLYPEFDRVVCYNNLKPGQLEMLQTLDTPLYKQSEADLNYPLVPASAEPGWKYSMPGWGWKLCPPRLRPESQELWIDNDIMILRRMPALDDWLGKDVCLISEGLQRAYGDFDDQIPIGTHYCAGFFGLPPHFDFASKIDTSCKRLAGKPLGYYNEQGLVVTVVLEAGHLLVPQSQLRIVKKLEKPYSAGLHFIGANRTRTHEPWEQYKCYMLI